MSTISDALPFGLRDDAAVLAALRQGDQSGAEARSGRATSPRPSTHFRRAPHADEVDGLDAIAGIDALFTRYHRWLYGLFMRTLRDREAATTALGQTLGTVAAARLTRPEQLRPAITRAAYEACLRVGEGRGRAARGRRTPDGTTQILVGIIDSGGDGELRRLVWRAMENLAYRERLLFELEWHDELDARELVAVVGGRNAQTIVNRARDRIRATLTTAVAVWYGSERCTDLRRLVRHAGAAEGRPGAMRGVIEDHLYGTRSQPGCATCRDSQDKYALVVLGSTLPMFVVPSILREQSIEIAAEYRRVLRSASADHGLLAFGAFGHAGAAGGGAGGATIGGGAAASVLGSSTGMGGAVGGPGAAGAGLTAAGLDGPAGGAPGVGAGITGGPGLAGGPNGPGVNGGPSGPGIGGNAGSGPGLSGGTGSPGIGGAGQHGSLQPIASPPQTSAAGHASGGGGIDGPTAAIHPRQTIKGSGDKASASGQAFEQWRPTPSTSGEASYATKAPISGLKRKRIAAGAAAAVAAMLFSAGVVTFLQAQAEDTHTDYLAVSSSSATTSAAVKGKGSTANPSSPPSVVGPAQPQYAGAADTNGTRPKPYPAPSMGAEPPASNPSDSPPPTGVTGTTGPPPVDPTDPETTAPEDDPTTDAPTTTPPASPTPTRSQATRTPASPTTSAPVIIT